jgi:hypothetical protein
VELPLSRKSASYSPLKPLLSRASGKLVLGKSAAVGIGNPMSFRFCATQSSQRPFLRHLIGQGCRTDMDSNLTVLVE